MNRLTAYDQRFNTMKLILITNSNWLKIDSRYMLLSDGKVLDIQYGHKVILTNMSHHSIRIIIVETCKHQY